MISNRELRFGSFDNSDDYKEATRIEIGSSEEFDNMRRGNWVEKFCNNVIAIGVKKKTGKVSIDEVVSVYATNYSGDTIARYSGEMLNYQMTYSVDVVQTRLVPSNYFLGHLILYAPIVYEDEPFKVEFISGPKVVRYVDNDKKIHYYKYDCTKISEEEYRDECMRSLGFYTRGGDGNSRGHSLLGYGMMDNVLSYIRKKEENSLNMYISVPNISMNRKSVALCEQVGKIPLADILYAMYNGLHTVRKDGYFMMGGVVDIDSSVFDRYLRTDGKVLAVLGEIKDKQGSKSIIVDTESGKVDRIIDSNELIKYPNIVRLEPFFNNVFNSKMECIKGFGYIPVNHNRYIGIDGEVDRNQFIRNCVKSIGYCYVVVDELVVADYYVRINVDKDTLRGTAKMPLIFYKKASMLDNTDVETCAEDDSILKVVGNSLYLGQSIYKIGHTASDLIENLRGNIIERNGDVLLKVKGKGEITLSGFKRIAPGAILVRQGKLTLKGKIEDIGNDRIMQGVEVYIENSTTLYNVCRKWRCTNVVYTGEIDGMLLLVMEAIESCFSNAGVNRQRYVKIDIETMKKTKFDYVETYKLFSEVNKLWHRNSATKKYIMSIREMYYFWKGNGVEFDICAIRDISRDLTYDRLR